MGGRVWALYVHPRTGLLCRQKPRRRDRAAERRKKIEQADYVRLDPKTYARKIKDLWFLFQDTGRTRTVERRRRDRNGKLVIQREQVPDLRKKQANSREVRNIRAAVEEVCR